MKWLVIILGCLLIGPMVSAGLNDGGTDSPFSLGAGARDLALGGASILVGDATTAAYWNPARLGDAEHIAISGFHSQLYESDVAYQYFGTALPTLDWGTLGIGVFRLGISGIEKRDDGNQFLGEFDDSRLGVYVAYGKAMASYNVGAALYLEHHSLDEYKSTSSPGLSLSLSRRFSPGKAWLNSVSVGATVRNVLSPSLELVDESVSYPVSIDIAGALNAAPGESGIHQATLSARMTKTEFMDARWSVGLEYGYHSLLAIRGGLRDDRLSFGAGLSYRNIGFDYALVDRDLGSLHMFTLTTAFGSSRSERLTERSSRRETEFNALMSSRLTQQNQVTVDKLMVEGRELLANDSLEAAAQLLDRALFLARGSGFDTTAVCELSALAHQQLANRERKDRYDLNIEAARARLAVGDFFAARHYADLAMADSADAVEASQIQREAVEAIDATEAKDEMIRQRLRQVDSLLSYGLVDEAVIAVRTLRDYAQEDLNVILAVKRVEFERWRQVATEAYTSLDLGTAQGAVDTAETLFPGHQWCVEMRHLIAQAEAGERQAVEELADRAAAPARPALTGEMRRQVENANREAQKAFERGDLTTAIEKWETVERLAPDYLTVRKYLVNAYKFVGVEQYGLGEMDGAVATWKKAARLDPSNSEIREYIRRTENEILKLRELSYEQ